MSLLLYIVTAKLEVIIARGQILSSSSLVANEIIGNVYTTDLFYASVIKPSESCINSYRLR